jgi:hypothetical protein
VTLAVPELVSVRGAVTVLPTSGDPKLRVAGAAVIAPRVVPVEATWAPTPDSEMDAVSFTLAAVAAGRPRRRTWLGVDREALLVSEITPARVPLARGAKVTVKFRVWPGSRVEGRLRPLVAKSLLLATTCEIVRLVPPELVTVADRV